MVFRLLSRVDERIRKRKRLTGTVPRRLHRTNRGQLLSVTQFKNRQNVAILLVHLECPFVCLWLVHGGNSILVLLEAAVHRTWNKVKSA